VVHALIVSLKKMHSVEIKAELYASMERPNGWQAIQHLVRRFRNFDSDLLRDAMLSVFEDDSPNRLAVQEVAGGILWLLKPSYDRDISTDLGRLVPKWDVSVEELPWYLAEVGGIEATRTAAKNRLLEDLPAELKKRYETVVWWLSPQDPRAFRQALDNRWRGRLKC
jgi:hypothetical protein